MSWRSRTAEGLTGRGQANLIALGAALVVLTGLSLLAVGLAGDAVTEGDRKPLERHAAVALADRLTDADGPVSRRPNVLDRDALATLTPGDIDRLVPSLAGAAVDVRLDGRPVVSRGDPVGGTTVVRVVHVAVSATNTSTAPLDTPVALPRGAVAVRLSFAPTPGTVVHTVRMDGRVALHDPSGLAGEWRVPVSRLDAVTLVVETDGGGGTVTVRAETESTTAARLVVTVDA